MDNAATTTPVKYIGRHKMLTDHQHGTGIWEQHQVKLIEDVLAVRMLRQTDAFVAAEHEESVNAQTLPPDIDKAVDPKVLDEDRMEEARESVRNLPKAQLLEYAQTHYGQKLDARASVDKTRASVISMIDRFGAL